MAQIHKTPAQEATKSAEGLHVCPECASQLTQPTCWEQTPKRGTWKLWRRCPDCEWHGEGIFSEREIDDYDERLDHGTRELAGELRVLEQANMRAFLECFVTALDADLIRPEDF